MRDSNSGYTNCEACDGPAMGALCEWCRLGALENNCDPDSIGAPDFNTQVLAIWRASGEAICDAHASREDDAQTKRRLVFDAAHETADAIRTTAIAAAERAHSAALDVAWINMRDHVDAADMTCGTCLCSINVLDDGAD